MLQHIFGAGDCHVRRGDAPEENGIWQHELHLHGGIIQRRKTADIDRHGIFGGILARIGEASDIAQISADAANAVERRGLHLPGIDDLLRGD